MTPRKAPLVGLTAEELRELWPGLSTEERHEAFDHMVSRTEREDFFISLSARHHAELLLEFPADRRRAWLRLLAPDDVVDLIQEAPPEERETLIGQLDPFAQREVRALLAYAEDDAGGLMSPRYTRVRPDMRADEAISYLRKQARERSGAGHYVYVTDEAQRLLGVLSFRELFAAAPDALVRDVMLTDPVTAKEQDDQEELGRRFAEYDLMAIPVVDDQGRMKGIVTVDDIMDVVEEEATEDIQKFGGVQALEEPYLEVGFAGMLRKRAPWLAVLFVGEMLTATAMAYFEAEIAQAVVLALFIPLIISSGGNSGSQASTLVIRAMALGEVSLRDFWRVTRRELATGLALGAILGAVGLMRVAFWGAVFDSYGPHFMLLGLTVAGSLVGVVLFGTLAGSLLPFILRWLNLDPASASAPFVATLVDVAGVVIYFTFAAVLLRGALL
ncbi:MAG TPA: magnesium transporter [Vicinamibacterales bacterium]|nr:magnesium transporter [Vicinamibacterales bacterium]